MLWFPEAVRFLTIGEERIQDAQQRGLFENLLGKGTPIKLDDMIAVS